MAVGWFICAPCFKFVRFVAIPYNETWSAYLLNLVWFTKIDGLLFKSNLSPRTLATPFSCSFYNSATPGNTCWAHL